MEPYQLREITNKKYEYHTQLIEFEGDVNQALTSMTLQSGLFIHATQWSSYYQSLPAGGKTLLVSDRLKSVKSVFTIFNIPSADNRVRNLGRTHANITGFKVKIGSNYYPNQAIQGTHNKNENGEFVVELYKAVSEFSNVSHTSLINAVNFDTEDQTIDSVGRACYGIDLDNFSKANVESGVNMILNNPLIVELDTTGNVAALDARVFLLHDVILCVKSDGTFCASK